MAASPPATGQLPLVDPKANDESHPELEAKSHSQSDSPSGPADGATSQTEAEPVADLSVGSAPDATDHVRIGQPHSDDDGNLTFRDLQAAVDEMDENLDDAFGQAADTFWNFATSVTGKVSSVVKDQPGLETLRKNVTSRLPPLSNIGCDLQTQIGTLAPGEKSIASIAGSVKSVAETVQRNAVAMEEAILARANDVGDSSVEKSLLDGSTDLATDDPGIAVLPEMQDGNGLNEIAKVGESVSNALEKTVGGLWSGLWGTTGDVNEKLEQKKAKIPKTRFGKRIFELQANPDTYCEPAKDLDAFEEWGKDFNLDNYEAECMELLYTHDAIADLYERVVPRVVEENTFWMRYFFAKHSLEMEEERRQKLLERAENTVEGADDEVNDWGDDDWGEESPDQDDGSVKAKGEPREGPFHDANTVQGSATPSETVEQQSDVHSMQKLSSVGGESSERASTKIGDVHKDTKEQNRSKGEPAAEVAVQGGDDDWGDDDWE